MRWNNNNNRQQQTKQSTNNNEHPKKKSICTVNCSEDEERLVRDLFRDYNKLIRPVKLINDSVKVNVKLQFVQLINIVSIFFLFLFLFFCSYLLLIYDIIIIII